MAIDGEALAVEENSTDSTTWVDTWLDYNSNQFYIVDYSVDAL
jgi:hypothetical protein